MNNWYIAAYLCKQSHWNRIWIDSYNQLGEFIIIYMHKTRQVGSFNTSYYPMLEMGLGVHRVDLVHWSVSFQAQTLLSAMLWPKIWLIYRLEPERGCWNDFTTSNYYIRTDKTNFGKFSVNLVPFKASFQGKIYTIWGTFGPKNSFYLSPSVHQYHEHARSWWQIVPIVCRRRLIYGFNDFACLDKLLYTNIHNLGHFWAKKYIFSVPICQPVSCRCK